MGKINYVSVTYPDVYWSFAKYLSHCKTRRSSVTLFTVKLLALIVNVNFYYASVEVDNRLSLYTENIWDRKW